MFKVLKFKVQSFFGWNFLTGPGTQHSTLNDKQGTPQISVQMAKLQNLEVFQDEMTLLEDVRCTKYDVRNS